MIDIIAGAREPSLLHVDSAASRDGDSVSRKLTALFAETWCGVHGTDGYRYRDVATDPVPPIGPAYVALGRRLERTGLVPPAEVAARAGSEAETREWTLTLPLVDELRAAGTVLLGVPMYNFSVPASLKAWIDRVSFPGAFLDPATGSSVLHGTQVIAVMARGGGYGPGSPRESFDFQEPYLRAYFSDLGVAEEDIALVPAEFTLANLVPALAGFREFAASSRKEAAEALVTLAGWPG